MSSSTQDSSQKYSSWELWRARVIAHIRRATFVSRVQFDTDPDLLVVKNGILNLQTDKLHDFTPEHLSLRQIPVEFNPDAKSPQIEKFLSEIARPEDVETLKELFGFLLISSYFIQKAAMLTGEGNNGKGTYLNLITRFLGEKNCSHEPLQDLV
jgi:putative DNA primase/helicase